MPNRIVHFEIHVTDLEKAKKFYGGIFEWEFRDAKVGIPYWLIITASEGSTEPGINGGMLLRNAGVSEPGKSPNAWVGTVSVDDFDAIHEKIVSRGGGVAMPKTAMAGLAWIGYYFDLDGNIFGVYQEDKNAQ